MAIVEVAIGEGLSRTYAGSDAGDFEKDSWSVGWSAHGLDVLVGVHNAVLFNPGQLIMRPTVISSEADSPDRKAA